MPRYQNKQTFYKGVYEQNEALCKSKDVNIPKSTFVYSYEVEKMEEKKFDSNDVEFYDVTTDQGVILANDTGFKNIVAMNFASNRYPGGGYKNGASAQEEDCCRLFPTLYASLSGTVVYDKRRNCCRSAYTFDKRNVIVTPNVKLMRDSTKKYVLLKGKDMVTTYFVSAAAPNLRHEEFSGKQVETTLMNTFLAPIKTFNLTTPEENCLILGAWGCGAYCNDPDVMSTYMKEAVEKYGGYYGKIIFAIPDKHGLNYRGFAKAFGK